MSKNEKRKAKSEKRKTKNEKRIAKNEKRKAKKENQTNFTLLNTSVFTFRRPEVCLTARKHIIEQAKKAMYLLFCRINNLNLPIDL